MKSSLYTTHPSNSNEFWFIVCQSLGCKSSLKYSVYFFCCNYHLCVYDILQKLQYDFKYHKRFLQYFQISEQVSAGCTIDHIHLIAIFGKTKIQINLGEESPQKDGILDVRSNKA